MNNRDHLQIGSAFNLAPKMSSPKSLPVQKLPADIARDVKMIINAYPRISNRIVLLWGSAELQIYLNSLIMDNVDGHKGFPQPIADAILRIHGENGKLVSDDYRNANSRMVIY